MTNLSSKYVHTSRICFNNEDNNNNEDPAGDKSQKTNCVCGFLMTNESFPVVFIFYYFFFSWKWVEHYQFNE